MNVQRAEGVFKEDFELDASRIKPQQQAVGNDFQADPSDQPQRKKPAWMRPADATAPAGTQPLRNSGGFHDFRFSGGSAEKAGETTICRARKTVCGDARELCSLVLMMSEAVHVA